MKLATLHLSKKNQLTKVIGNLSVQVDR